MTVQSINSNEQARAILVGWLKCFAAAILERDSAKAAGCFLPDGYWKDILAFSWEHRYFDGSKAIAEAFELTMDRTEPSAFRVSPDRMAPRIAVRATRHVVEGFFDFDTKVASATAFVRLELSPEQNGKPLAWILLTSFQQLKGFEETIGARRPTGQKFAQNTLGRSWLEDLEDRQSLNSHETEVAIIGAGQAGLTIAARLSQMGVEPLVLERTPRIGDVWRDRYRSLTLHNEMMANHLPYISYPETWPLWLTKDHLAIWLETYATTMSLNVWASTSIEKATWSEAEKIWTLTLVRDGKNRTLLARHVVMATGVNGSIPHLGELPGLDTFAGEILHSSAFKDGAGYKGKNAIVVGTGNSAHDVAQDLYMKGAKSVHIMQRGPTCIVSLQPSAEMVYKIYANGDPIEDVDLMAASIPYPVLVESYRFITEKAARLDGDMLHALNSKGLRTHFGKDGTGFQMMFMRGKGGYYIDVGCAQLIVDGKIGIIQHSDMEKIESDGLRLKDGSLMPVDLVVLATGFKNMQENLRLIFGDEVAERIGPVWGFDKHCQMRAMWRRTEQDGLWITGGSLLDSRIFSRFLAIEIKASLEGILPDRADLPFAACAPAN
jgi:cation diffusion facilitator CzcD-associated flavoprotein CzcO